ncbi:PHB depolymerase family esterase [Acuticoccus sp. I52.16.1]|uniref:alpha/beta hydrolase family esterase n=1 Tax=Acuticoccus sp. I52.16.1 TaxID=2928472 RepID=UPI001FD1A3A9|nr:alpha/beta fold hydrolase [Acuticoccus sp. I52.16.1]UOM35545.1 hypothetical protein MRB58_04875 [Acuticoccus sp. I52.16.1]
MSVTQIFCVLLLIVVGGMIAVAQPTAAAVSQTENIRSGGDRRAYYMVRPTRQVDASKRYPIVVLLHGGYGNGRSLAKQTTIEGDVTRDEFIAVLPNAVRNRWNDGRSVTSGGADDVKFVLDVVADVVARFNGDPDLVFLAGLSSGGMLTQRIACERPRAFKAYAAVAANLPEDLYASCAPNRGVPFLFFNGTQDNIMPYNGGPIPRSRLLRGGGGNVLSTNDTFSLWAGLAGCSGQRTVALEDNADDGTSVTRVIAKACQNEMRVELYRVDGGGHTWPGSSYKTGRLSRRLFGITSEDIDATRLIVGFFRSYGL